MTIPDPYRDLLGTGLPADRLEADLAAYAPILAEIRKLRALDLSDVHPAVVFRPLASAADERR